MMKDEAFEPIGPGYTLRTWRALRASFTVRAVAGLEASSRQCCRGAWPPNAVQCKGGGIKATKLVS
jgi:hypothetical protein